MQNPPAHELHMTTLITPAMANFSGNLHGGELLKMLDQVAYACASRYSGNMCVTLSVDNVIFKEPIHVGELVNYYASVNLVGAPPWKSASAWKPKISKHAPCATPILAISPWLP